MLTENERADYEKIFITDFPNEDLDWLIGALLHTRRLKKREKIPIEFKICDKCQRTFPLYTTACHQCGDENLRQFSTEHNHEEILDGVNRH